MGKSVRNKPSGSAGRSNGHKIIAVLQGKGRDLGWALGKFSVVIKVQTACGGSSPMEDRRGYVVSAHNGRGRAGHALGKRERLCGVLKSFQHNFLLFYEKCLKYTLNTCFPEIPNRITKKYQARYFYYCMIKNDKIVLVLISGNRNRHSKIAHQKDLQHAENTDGN